MALADTWIVVSETEAEAMLRFLSHRKRESSGDNNKYVLSHRIVMKIIWLNTNKCLKQCLGHGSYHVHMC